MWEPRPRRAEVVDQRLLHAEEEGGDDGQGERREPADEGGGEGGYDECRKDPRLDVGVDRGDEDSEQAGDRGRQHPVDRRQPVGGEAEHDRAALVLRRRPCRQSEAGSLEHEPEDDGEDDDQHGHEELFLGEREDPEVDLVLVHERERLDRPRGQREATDHDRLENEQQADGRDDLGEDRCVAQRAEDQPMDRQAEDDAEQERHDERRPERHRLRQERCGSASPAGRVRHRTGTSGRHLRRAPAGSAAAARRGHPRRAARHRRRRRTWRSCRWRS